MEAVWFRYFLRQHYAVHTGGQQGTLTNAKPEIIVQSSAHSTKCLLLMLEILNCTTHSMQCTNSYIAWNKYYGVTQ